MQTIVIGHKNPDMDSICSAIAYAELKRKLGVPDVIAARAGNTSRRLFLCHRLPVGQPMTLERVRAAVRRVMGRSGLTGPHRLRHSFATRLHARGASLKEVADVLDHQHFDTTAIYA